MPKIFAVSDIHGFYDELIEALSASGFDKDNEDHWLVSCGDHFDRGKDPGRVMSFLNSLDRKILIRGNHEDLLEECCRRGHPASYDYSNGTWDTIAYFGKKKERSLCMDICEAATLSTRHFLFQMRNYFETKNYIFVHGWIPLNDDVDMPAYYQYGHSYSFNHYWREASEAEWSKARWMNGFLQEWRGLYVPEKKIVFGHWHTSYGRAVFDSGEEFGENSCFDIYEMDHSIGIDACTAYSKKVNVLVLDDEFI